MKEAIIIGGSRGIGKAIAESLLSIGYKIIATSTNELDTSNIKSIQEFLLQNKETDVLVLNTGGPPKKNFFDISEEEWNHYHKQLFLGFCIILQKLRIRNNGFVFLISSGVIKEPNSDLILSSAYRIAFSNVFKVLSKNFGSRNISCINIAPGSIKTDRLNEIKNMSEFEKTLPMKRTGDPKEIGNFVKSIVENNIKYLSGVVINFDGAQSNYIF